MQDNFRRESWISIAVIVGSLLVYGGLVWWFDRDLEAKAKDVALSRSLINQRAKSIEVLANLKRNSREVESRQEIMAQLIPVREELLNFPRWLEGIARLHGVAMVFSFDPGTTPPQGDRPGHENFRLTANGSYEELERFFRDIEQQSSRFLLSLNSFDLVRTESDYRATVLGRVYYR
jgi:Tfp pilus assembly protein PilO